MSYDTEAGRIVVVLGPTLNERCQEMCKERGRRLGGLVIQLLEDELERYGHIRWQVVKDGKTAKAVGRPLDPDVTRRGKNALLQIGQTYGGLRSGSNKDSFEELYGKDYALAMTAAERKDWEYLIRFNELQPWLRHKDMWAGHEEALDIQLAPG